jgi:hypothetical protein
VTPREQTGDCKLYRVILAYDKFANLFCERVNVVCHREMICGNDAFRKRDMRRIELARRNTILISVDAKEKTSTDRERI